jgi:hypothetical protein
MKTENIILGAAFVAAALLLKKSNGSSAIGGTQGNRCIRSRLYDFSELPSDQQEEHEEYHSEDTFVKAPGARNEYLPLGMFMRTTGSKMWQGVYSQDAFSAYFIKFNKSNDEALVCYRWV